MTAPWVAFQDDRLTCLCRLKIKKPHAEQIFYTFFFFFAHLRLKFLVYGIHLKIRPEKNCQGEEEEHKLICCNSVSKENITSAPFYSRRMPCGGLCKDCSLGRPCALQQCTHAPKQNLQDHKAANSILGHLRPEATAFEPGHLCYSHYHAGTAHGQGWGLEIQTVQWKPNVFVEIPVKLSLHEHKNTRVSSSGNKVKKDFV